MCTQTEEVRAVPERAFMYTNRLCVHKAAFMHTNGKLCDLCDLCDRAIAWYRGSLVFLCTRVVLITTTTRCRSRVICIQKN